MKMPKIIAHRGVFDNENIIENTMEAFELAIKYKYPFEFDVQLTTDNKLVVFHDVTLERLAKKNRVVQNMDSSELTRIKLGDTNSTMPYLSDVLKLNNDRVLMDIEVKPTSRINDTISQLMKELDGYHNYVIISFDPRIIRKIKKEYPSVLVGLLIQSKYDNLFYNWLLHTKFILNYSKCNFVSISKKVFKNKKFRKRFSKYPMYLWTIKNNKEVNYNDNITYVCNNLPYIKKED